MPASRPAQIEQTNQDTDSRMYIITATAAIAAAIAGYFIGKKSNKEQSFRIGSLEAEASRLQSEATRKDKTIEIQRKEITALTAECEVEKARTAHTIQQLDEVRQQHIRQQEADEERHSANIRNIETAYSQRIEELKASFAKQLQHIQDAHEKQLATLREMHGKQLKSQTDLIKEQITATSEAILKAREEELGERNKEQVSKIIDPLQQSLKDMQEALLRTKEQQHEALTRLDETIKINMEKSTQLGETADRLTRALTGEVKIQGNFGELKLKQLLEDLELHEGEQFDTQQTLRDKAGKAIKSDEGTGMIPDFILHFPNNRHVVVDAKMSLTDYERYMNCEDELQRTIFLKAHISSVRSQVKRLSRKDYTRFLPAGYNKLSFVLMYIPIEGALDLALMNDGTLWREAYDDGVMIVGPQTMYMNLRVLEMMWTQVRQLNNQQAMIDAANIIIDRVQDFGIRFLDVEASMHETIAKIGKLKITTSENGASIITAARNLIKAGAKENKKKKNIEEINEILFIDSDHTIMLDSCTGTASSRN